VAIERKIRKALNIKQDNLEFHGNPSVGGMSDGQIAIEKGNNGQLAIHRKKYGKLWKSYMSYDGIQYVDKDIVVKNDVVYNGFLRNQHYPAFKAYSDTTGDEQTINNTTMTRVTFDKIAYDIGGNYDVSAYKFTAPVAGIYHFNAKVLWDDSNAGDWDAGERRDIYLVKNGGTTTISAGDRTDASLYTVTSDLDDKFQMGQISADVKLDTGDFMEVGLYHDSGEAQRTYNQSSELWSSWSGHLITAI